MKVYKPGRFGSALTVVVVLAGTATALALAGTTGNHASPGGHARVTVRSPAAGASSSPSALPSFGPSVAACEQQSNVCDPAAAANLPLAKPDSTGATLLSRSSVLSQLGWSDVSVGAVEMSYKQAQQSYSDLAAATPTLVDPTRQVWVITRYFDPPVSVPVDGGWGPAAAPSGSPSTTTMSAETVVIDSETGTETDACGGCADIAANTQ